MLHMIFIKIAVMATGTLHLQKKKRKKKELKIFTEYIRGMKLKLSNNVHNNSYYENQVSVAIPRALSSQWQLNVFIDIMEKVKVVFFLSVIRDI